MSIVKAHTDALNTAFAAVADITSKLVQMRHDGPVDWGCVSEADGYAQSLRVIADMAMQRGEYARAVA